MALKESVMVKSDLDLGIGDVLELKAKTGESLLVKDVIIRGASDDYVVFDIDRTTVGFFRVDGHYLGSHLMSSQLDLRGTTHLVSVGVVKSPTLLNLLIERGWMRGYPVAEGQTFIVKPYDSSEKLGTCVIIYEKYDAGDIKATDPNGSEAKEYIFINYGRPQTNLTEAGDYEVKVPVTAKEFIDFPFGASVPSKTTVEILGILGSESIMFTSDTQYTNTRYLKLFKERTCLFDRDKYGLPFYQYTWAGMAAGVHFARGFSVVGNYSHKDGRLPFIPSTPLVFSEGDEVKVYITAGQGDSADTLNVKYAEIAFIERVKVGE